MRVTQYSRHVMFATLIIRVTLISRFFENREIREISVAKISCNKVRGCYS